MSIERKQGEVLYLIYELHFPVKNDMWQNCHTIVHSLGHYLKNSFLRHDPSVCEELIRKGETSFWSNHDTMGPTRHVLRIEKEPVQVRWGPGQGNKHGDILTKPVEKRIEAEIN